MDREGYAKTGLF